MENIQITNAQARRFILAKQGLLGKKRFVGKDGVLEFIRQAGCIQFDPVDACGKNAELTLQSRIEGFRKQMLWDLLYLDRKLIDHFDKMMSVFPIGDWPYFERDRAYFREEARSREAVAQVREALKAAIREKGFVCSKDLDFPDKVHWYWSDQNLARVALEALYYYGELVIHHKVGMVKYYSLAEDTLPKAIFEQKDPLSDGLEHRKWRVLRRIGATGLLWNRHSDAFLFLDLKTEERNRVFHELETEGKILRVTVEGQKDDLFCLATDRELLEETRNPEKSSGRVEFIAPLDPMMWDRKLIKALFAFEYTWEIYTVESKRKYGYYVLPILYEDQLVGRIEMTHDRKNKTLLLKNVWVEAGWIPTQNYETAFAKALERFRLFNDCDRIENTIPERKVPA